MVSVCCHRASPLAVLFSARTAPAGKCARLHARSLVCAAAALPAHALTQRTALQGLRGASRASRCFTASLPALHDSALLPVEVRPCANCSPRRSTRDRAQRSSCRSSSLAGTADRRLTSRKTARCSLPSINCCFRPQPQHQLPAVSKRCPRAAAAQNSTAARYADAPSGPHSSRNRSTSPATRCLRASRLACCGARRPQHSKPIPQARARYAALAPALRSTAFQKHSSSSATLDAPAGPIGLSVSGRHRHVACFAPKPASQQTPGASLALQRRHQRQQH